MRFIYFVLGIILIPFGVTVYYVNRYLAEKQEELRAKGDWLTNVYWPILGPRPWMAAVLIFAGVVFLLAFVLK